MKSIFSYEKLFPGSLSIRLNNTKIVIPIMGYYVKEKIDKSTIPYGWECIGITKPVCRDFNEMLCDIIVEEEIEIVDISDAADRSENDNIWTFITNRRGMSLYLFDSNKIIFSFLTPGIEEKFYGICPTMLSVMGFDDISYMPTLNMLWNKFDINNTIIYDVQSGEGSKLSDIGMDQLSRFIVLDVASKDHPSYRMATDKRVIDVISKDLFNLPDLLE